MTKNKIILVNPTLKKSTFDAPVTANDIRIYPYPAMMVFATMLNRAGYNVVLIDGNRYDYPTTLRKIQEENDESNIFIGFTVMTSMVLWVYETIKMIKACRRDSVIVVGGVHPSLFPEQTIENEFIDVVAVNDFTKSIIPLAEALKKGRNLENIPSILFKRDGLVIKTPVGEIDDIEQIPFEDFELIDGDYYKVNNGMRFPIKEDVFVGHLLTGLGCTHRCAFCYSTILRQKYRFKTAEDIVDRIEYLMNRHGITMFYFTDENFFASKKRIYRFIELVEKKTLKFTFRAYARGSYFNDNHLSQELLNKLRSIGMVYVAFGAESGTDRVLAMLDKGLTVEQTRKAVRMLIEAEMYISLSFMIGIPGEKEHEIRDTVRFALELMESYKRIECAVNGFIVYPGSPLSEKAVKQFGLRIPQSFEEWAGRHHKGSSDLLSPFYGSQEKPWVPNKNKFDIRLKYLSLYKGIVDKMNRAERRPILLMFFRKTIKFRLLIDVFILPFEIWANRIKKKIIVIRRAG